MLTHFATLAWTLGVAAMLLVPGSAHPQRLPWPDGTDKLVHLLLFTGQTALMARSAQVLGLRRPRLAAGIVSLVLALSLESAQHWVPRRHVEPADFVANCAGIVLGMVLGRHRQDETEEAAP